MHASAFQVLHKENAELRKAAEQLDREVKARDQHIQQLAAILQQRDRAIVNLNTTIAAILYTARPEAPAKRLQHRLSGRAPAARQEHGSITISRKLIEEIAGSPFLFEAKQTRDPDTGHITLSARRRSRAEIEEIQAQVQAEQAAIAAAAATDAERQKAEATDLVSPDGRPAREAEKSKILTLQ